jgi:hypothetical protein
VARGRLARGRFVCHISVWHGDALFATFSTRYKGTVKLRKIAPFLLFVILSVAKDLHFKPTETLPRHSGSNFNRLIILIQTIVIMKKPYLKI